MRSEDLNITNIIIILDSNFCLQQFVGQKLLVGQTKQKSFHKISVQICEVVLLFNIVSVFIVKLWLKPHFILFNTLFKLPRPHKTFPVENSLSWHGALYPPLSKHNQIYSTLHYTTQHCTAQIFPKKQCKMQ